MATARKVQLSLANAGVFSAGPREDTAQTASQLLQDDLENHHVFFNNEGFHNHLVHQILTMFALGASPDEVTAAYNRNKNYQRPALPSDEAVVQSLSDKARFRELTGKGQNYPHFLAFFQQEIDKKGVGYVLNEYVFKGDDNAEDMLSRLFGGLLHPIIHLGFGLEFHQPAIVAEALAQTAVHEDTVARLFLLPAETRAGGVGKPGKKPMLQILEEIRANQKLANSVHWSDGNKIRDGVLKRASEEMIQHAAEFTVSEDQVTEKVAEMINVPVYYTSAAQRPPKKIKLDFFFLHSLNSSIFLSTFVALPFLDVRSKLRLLEWKGRMDLLLYVSRGTPNLLLDEVTGHRASDSWNTLFAHGNAHPGDDGHLSKAMRAIAHGEIICRPFEAQAREGRLAITGDMWLKVGNMAKDSTLKSDNMWVRSTGFEEAWAGVEDRARL
ncbi:questin oxidase family protein [Aspergillus candidus]|uniref:HypA-like protein n=1 Tax=Aspergillus candidus TaxID=41067 RepID=A0A2I2FP02_ASPCN|nr:hypA-like protein [Aspergillus candidus]PLB42343.1 hypA-like protein [Aspergillus candidus]